jgi:hypothetical protein
MLHTNLDKNQRGKQIDVSALPRAIYLYEIVFAGCGKTTGKIYLK